MKTILANCDSPENLQTIVRSAINLSKFFNSSITFAHITENANSNDHQLQEKLNELIKQSGSMPEYKILTKTGKQYVELLNIAKELDARTVITHASGSSGFKLFKDNTLYHAVVAAPCPVFTLTNTVQINEIKNVLLPLDTSETTRQKIPFAIQVAKHFRATVHLVGFGTDKGDEEKRIKLKRYTEQSAHFMSEKGIASVSTVVFGKDFVDMVNYYASKNKIDLTIALTDEETSMFGSPAERLLITSPVPVLNIQPKDLKVSWAGL